MFRCLSEEMKKYTEPRPTAVRKSTARIRSAESTGSAESIRERAEGKKHRERRKGRSFFAPVILNILHKFYIKFALTLNIYDDKFCIFWYNYKVLKYEARASVRNADGFNCCFDIFIFEQNESAIKQ